MVVLLLALKVCASHRYRGYISLETGVQMVLHVTNNTAYRLRTLLELSVAELSPAYLSELAP